MQVATSKQVLAFGLMLASLAGCASAPKATQALAVESVSAPEPARRLVVVLPGRLDDLTDLRDVGVAGVIHAVWPDADVMLVDLALPYYVEGTAAERLEHDVMEPARRRGYRETWLCGASLGGLGALGYDSRHPGAIDGLLLLAPFLGDAPLIASIEAAGGLSRWNPDDPASVAAGEPWQRDIWRHVRGWRDAPDDARRAWVAFGERDRLRRAEPLLSEILPAGHLLVRPGRHAWSTWLPALNELLARAEAERKAGEAKPK